MTVLGFSEPGVLSAKLTATRATAPVRFTVESALTMTPPVYGRLPLRLKTSTPPLPSSNNSLIAGVCKPGVSALPASVNGWSVPAPLSPLPATTKFSPAVLPLTWRMSGRGVLLVVKVTVPPPRLLKARGVGAAPLTALPVIVPESATFPGVKTTELAPPAGVL